MTIIKRGEIVCVIEAIQYEGDSTVAMMIALQDFDFQDAINRSGHAEAEKNQFWNYPKDFCEWLSENKLCEFVDHSVIEFTFVRNTIAYNMFHVSHEMNGEKWATLPAATEDDGGEK